MNARMLGGLLTVCLSLGIPAMAQEEDDSHGVAITLSSDADDAQVARQVVEDIQQEVNRVIDKLPQDLTDTMSEDDRRRFESDLEGLRDLAKVTKESHDFHAWEEGHDMTGDITGLIAVLMLFGMPIMIVAIVSYNGRRKREMVHRTIERIVEHGREVPSELLETLDKGKDSQGNSLRRGVINIAVGAGLGICLYTVADEHVATVGLIPLFIGFAYLLIWWLERGKEGAGAA